MEVASLWSSGPKESRSFVNIWKAKLHTLRTWGSIGGWKPGWATRWLQKWQPSARSCVLHAVGLAGFAVCISSWTSLPKIALPDSTLQHSHKKYWHQEVLLKIDFLKHYLDLIVFFFFPSWKRELSLSLPSPRLSFPLFFCTSYMEWNKWRAPFQCQRFRAGVLREQAFQWLSSRRCYADFLHNFKFFAGARERAAGKGE